MVATRNLKYANSSQNYYVIMMAQKILKFQNRKFPIFFAFQGMKFRVKVHNTRFAVVVCVRHIVKRPSKRSALVLKNSESLKKSSNPWISRDSLEFWYVISMYHLLPIGKNEICNVSTFWSLHISHCIIVSFRTFWYFYNECSRSNSVNGIF